MPEAFTFLIKFIPKYFILVLSMVYVCCLFFLLKSPEVRILSFFSYIGVYSLYIRLGYIRIFSYQYRI